MSKDVRRYPQDKPCSLSDKFYPPIAIRLSASLSQELEPMVLKEERKR